MSNQTLESQVIDNFRKYLQVRINAKNTTLEGLRNTKYTESTLEWYKGQIVQLQETKRCFELIVLGEDVI